MFTKISSFVLAVLLFFGLLQSQASPYAFAGAVLILLFMAFAVNFRRLNFTWPHLLLPTLFIFATASCFAVISNPQTRLIFLLFASIAFFLLELRLGRESHLLQTFYLFSVFSIYLGYFALKFYFNLPLFLVIPLVFIASYLFALQGLSGFSLPAKKYFYFLIALLCAEAAWGLLLWPTHFFVDAVVLFSFFYLLWLFSFSAFFGKLSKQKIFWQVGIISIILILTFLTAAWKPVR